MRLWLYGALALALLSVLGASHYKAYRAGIDHQAAQQAREAQIVREAREAAIAGAADAIAKIQIQHTTIRQKVEREIVEKPFDGSCVADDHLLRLINQAITGGSEPASGGELPATGAPG